MSSVDVTHELLPAWRDAWIGREYWPNPAGLPRDPVHASDILRYTTAVRDPSPQWRDRDAALAASYADLAAPPGFVECFSPNYLHYHSLSGTEFLHRLLPFENPWGPDWTPLMLVRHERWTIDRPIVVGDVITGKSVITDIGWNPARGSRPDMLSIEFTKEYRATDGQRVAQVVWDMGFLESALTVSQRPDEDATERPIPLESPTERRPDSAALTIGQVVAQSTRLFDVEAQVSWSAAVWDLGLPHIDADYARKAYGLPHVVVAGPFVNASMATLVTGWLRPADRIVSHHGRFRRPVVGNDRVTFTARLIELAEQDDGQECTLRVEAHNQRKELVAESLTTCRLARSTA
ncbi:MAG: hypothetical protein EOP24_27095 [Hyphomicrobiales bacterium]|nr:MAG: hypothetical protein EOP24_27095 [Hyphomicrobiales bacterium]